MAFNASTLMNTILGIHFCYKKKLEQEKNFNILITKIKNVLTVWRMKNLKIEGKIVAYKSLVILKVVHRTLIISKPIFTI